MKRAGTIDIPQTLKEVCDPSRMALVVYDMQIGILKQLKNPEEIVGRMSGCLANSGKVGGTKAGAMRAPPNRAQAARDSKAENAARARKVGWTA